MKKFDFFIIVKWIIGVYFMGIILNFTTYVLSFIPELTYGKIMQSNFMTIELVYFADLVRQQLIPLFVVGPFVIPGLVILLIANLFLTKSKFFIGIHKKIYMTILSIFMAMMTLSIFLLS